MRLILMYDLEISTPEGQKSYTKFHRWIISRGYVMMQYSVYFKVLNTPTKVEYEINAMRINVPKNGNIRVLSITDAQYYNIKLLRGVKRINETINTEQRRVKIKYEE